MNLLQGSSAALGESIDMSSTPRAVDESAHFPGISPGFPQDFNGPRVCASERTHGAPHTLVVPQSTLVAGVVFGGSLSDPEPAHEPIHREAVLEPQLARRARHVATVPRQAREHLLAARLGSRP